MLKFFSKIILTKILGWKLNGLLPNDNKYIIYEKPKIDEYDPLRAELDNFVNSILKKEKPIVDGIAARNALDVVIKINEMILEDLN